MGKFSDLDKHLDNVQEKIKQEKDDWTRGDE
jgi:hypothetical protein